MNTQSLPYKETRSILEYIEKIEKEINLRNALSKTIKKCYSCEIQSIVLNNISLKDIFDLYPSIKELFHLNLGLLDNSKNTEDPKELSQYALCDFLRERFSKKDGLEEEHWFPSEVEHLISLGLLWNLYQKKALILKEFPPNCTISMQNKKDHRLLFNLDPVAIYHDGQKVAEIKETQMLGESALFKSPRSSSIWTPTAYNDLNRGFYRCMILDCHALKNINNELLPYLRRESFLAFLEKLSRANHRISILIDTMEEHKISWNHIIKPMENLPIGENAIDSMIKSDLVKLTPNPGLKDDFAKTLEEIAKIVQFKSQETIIPIYKQPEKLFIIHSGQVCVRDQRRRTLDYLQSGDIIGESVIAGTPTIAEVAAMEDVQAVMIEKDAILRSPFKLLFFLNCFYLLQDKLAATNLLAEGFEKLLADPKRVRILKSLYPLTKTKKLDDRSDTSSLFHRFSSVISETLNLWLGKDIERSDDELLNNIIDE